MTKTSYILHINVQIQTIDYILLVVLISVNFCSNSSEKAIKIWIEFTFLS